MLPKEKVEKNLKNTDGFIVLGEAAQGKALRALQTQ